MGDGSGDIAAEPPTKKPKKSRNRHAYKKNGKCAVYKFDAVGDNGLPPVRKLPKRHSYDDDLIKVIVEGGYGAMVAPLIGTDEATLKARYEFWSRERGDLFEQVPEEHRQKLKDHHHYLEDKTQRQLAGAESMASNFTKSLGTFSNILFENLWTSQRLHSSLEEGDHDATALVARFRQAMVQGSEAPAVAVGAPADTVVKATTREAASKTGDPPPSNDGPGSLVPGRSHADNPRNEKSLEWASRGPICKSRLAQLIADDQCDEYMTEEDMANGGDVDVQTFDDFGGAVHEVGDGGQTCESGGAVHEIGDGGQTSDLGDGGDTPTTLTSEAGRGFLGNALKCGGKLNNRGELLVTDELVLALFKDLATLRADNARKLDANDRKISRIDRKWHWNHAMTRMASHLHNEVKLWQSIKRNRDKRGLENGGRVLLDSLYRLSRFCEGCVQYVLRYCPEDRQEKFKEMALEEVSGLCSLIIGDYIKVAPGYFTVIWFAHIDDPIYHSFATMIRDLSDYQKEFITAKQATNLAVNSQMGLSQGAIVDMIAALINPDTGMEAPTQDQGPGSRHQLLQSYYAQLTTGVRARGVMRGLRTAMDQPTAIKITIAGKDQFDEIRQQLANANRNDTPATFSEMSSDFVLLFVHDNDKDDALALRIVAIHKCWQPHSVRQGEISLPDWLLRALTYCECNDKRDAKRWSTFRGFDFCRLRRLHEHFFAPEHQFPSVHAHRDGIVRAASCAIQIAAFYNHCPKFGEGQWSEVMKRVHRATKVILQHAEAKNAWYYIWCLVDGVGMRMWFRGQPPAGAY